MGKGQLGIVAALKQIEQRVPFPLRGIDSDNGSEFINTHLFNFCQQRPKTRKVQFTRSRPYKKDDNAHVEQKIWTHVRKLLGLGPLRHFRSPQHDQSPLRTASDLSESVPALHEASAKIRQGPRVMRHYDQPSTPLKRVLKSPHKTLPRIQGLNSRAKHRPFRTVASDRSATRRSLPLSGPTPWCSGRNPH